MDQSFVSWMPDLETVGLFASGVGAFLRRLFFVFEAVC